MNEDDEIKNVGDIVDIFNRLLNIKFVPSFKIVIIMGKSIHVVAKGDTKALHGIIPQLMERMLDDFDAVVIESIKPCIEPPTMVDLAERFNDYFSAEVRTGAFSKLTDDAYFAFGDDMPGFLTKHRFWLVYKVMAATAKRDLLGDLLFATGDAAWEGSLTKRLAGLFDE